MIKRKLARILMASVSCLMISPLCACESKDVRKVTIIDGDFAEMRLFTQIAKQMIENRTDIKVKVQDSMASSLAFEQIKNGKMDIYMRYDGSLLTAYLGHDPSEVPEGTSLYDYANELGKKEAGVMLSPKLGEQNTYVAAVMPETAEKYHLTKISDLKKYAHELTFAAEHEFFDEGSNHFDAFVSTYDLDFKTNNTIDRGLKYVGMNAGNMDVTVVYSTDGMNKRFGLVTLEDDQKFFPEYNGAYLLRADLYEDYPELEPIFEELAGKFDNEICTDLNYLIDVEVEDPKKVAREFLDENGLLRKEK